MTNTTSMVYDAYRRGIRDIRSRWVEGGVWMVCVILVTLQRDYFAAAFVGLPIGVSGFVVISGTRLRWVVAAILIPIAAPAVLLFYVWPYLQCPIELPPSAHKLYASTWGFWLSYHAAVRFDGNVEDCVTTADKLYRHYRSRLGRAYKPPVEISAKKGKPSPDILEGHREKDVEWWLKDTQNIQNGFYWEGGRSWEPEFWVDTKRGVFYMLLND